MKKKALNIILLFLIFVLLSHCAPQVYEEKVQTSPPGQPGKVFSGIGIALTPRHFPNHTPEDVRQMFRIGRDLGEYAVFIYQWSDPNLFSAVKAMLKLSQEWKYIPMIGLSPTILGGLRDKLDVPEGVRKKVKGNLSFSNPEVYKPYIETVTELARLKPPYLCLATEINLMAFSNINEYIYFGHVYKKLYPVIKKISPETKVFVSFQWDAMVILDRKEPNKIKEHSKLIKLFRPELDLIAFTSYPADHYAGAADLPMDYYSKIYDHVKEDDEIMFMEIGWPAPGKEHYAKQEKFIISLPMFMRDVKPKVLAWSLLHDVQTPQLSNDLATTGLITQKGEIKPAFHSYKELKDK